MPKTIEAQLIEANRITGEMLEELKRLEDRVEKLEAADREAEANDG